jgi:hypothetical protein
MKFHLSENENKVLEHLKEHPLTTLQAATSLNILNVYDVIFRLRNYGYNIVKEWIHINKKRYAKYYLIK